jgi:hypothetical protein
MSYKSSTGHIGLLAMTINHAPRAYVRQVIRLKETQGRQVVCTLFVIFFRFVRREETSVHGTASAGDAAVSRPIDDPTPRPRMGADLSL